jgi:hypothetical protein
MFKGYCYLANGRYLEPVILDSVEQAFEYLGVQMKLFSMVRIIDGDDCIVLESKNGEIVFPTFEEFKRYEKNKKGISENYATEKCKNIS